MQLTYDWLTQNDARYLLVVADGKLVFVGGPDDDLTTARHLLRLPATAELTPGAVPDVIRTGVAGLLDGSKHTLDSALFTVTGTPFQQQVYAALRQIPYGATVTYSQLATTLHQPRAVRAVAHAVASNPLLVVQPCHRVVPKSGGVGQYRGGKKMKESLIALESQFA
jgi:O-6-methylguanine DNA methyltransferase